MSTERPVPSGPAAVLRHPAGAHPRGDQRQWCGSSLPGQLGVGVQVPAQGDELLVAVGDDGLDQGPGLGRRGLGHRCRG